MFRRGPAGLLIPIAVILAPSFAVPDYPTDGPPPEAASNGEDARTGQVSVDLEESTPGLTPDVFRTTLTPHGEWYPSPRYGNVWRPRVAIGWKPYFYGSWQWTDEGWYWDSDEPFAWAVYHYGRWVYDPSWGWVWVPGYQWAPAWVTWRYGADAVGWAPLGPSVSVFVTAYPFVDSWWTFVPCDRFVGVPVFRVAYGPRDTHRWYRVTSPAPPRSRPHAPDGRPAPAVAPAWGGPSRRAIEERVGRPIEVVRRPPAGPRGGGDHGRETPGWTRPSDRPVPGGGERGGVRPAPRREDERRAPVLRPAPRGDEERRSPSVRPESRGEEERRPAPPPARRGEPRRSGNGRGR